MTDLEFLLAAGIPFKQVNDMWMGYFDTLSIQGSNYNDRMFKWLGDLGFTGSLPDRYSQWQKSDQTGTLPPQITLHPLDVPVNAEGEPVMMRSDGVNYDSILWEYFDGSAWGDIGGDSTSKDYYFPSSTGLTGVPFRVTYTNANGTTISDSAFIRVAAVRQFYTFGGDATLDGIEVPTIAIDSPDTIEFSFIAPTETVTQVTRLLGNAAASSMLYYDSAITVKRGTILLDGVAFATGGLMPTDGLKHTILFTSNVTGDNLRFVGGNTTTGGSPAIPLFDIKVVSAAGGNRFYPIDDGWAANPVLRETLGGIDATMRNGVESHWATNDVAFNGEEVVHLGETVIFNGRMILWQ